MTEAELDAAFEAAWTSEGFLTREHEEARLAAGRAALARFRAEQLRPGAVIPAYVERDFAFTLDGDRIRGRWDRVDIEARRDRACAERAAAPRSERARPPAPRRPTSSSRRCRSCPASGSRSPTTSRATSATRPRPASARATRSS